MIRLRTLGALDLQGSETEKLRVILSQPKRLALLAYLALAAPRGCHRRDTLIALFWPEHDAERARNSLSQSVHVLRRALGTKSIISGNGDAVGLNSSVVCCDAAEFEDSLDAGRIGDAIAIYGGALLEGFHLADAPDFERWLDAERSRLAARHAKAIAQLAEQRAAERDYDGAAALWRSLATHDPFSSRAALGLMRALAASGDPAAAVQHARAHELLLRDELDVAPDPEIAAFVRQLKAGGQAVGEQRGSRMSAHATATSTAAQLPDAPQGLLATAGFNESLVGDADLGGNNRPSQVNPRRRRSMLVRSAIVGVLALAAIVALRAGVESAQRSAARKEYLMDLYRRGRHAELDRSFVGVQSAMGYYRRAIEHDSTFALGYAGLSGAYGFLADYDYAPARPALDTARLLAARGMDIDSSLAGTRTAFAVTLAGDRNYEAAERHFLAALRADSGNAHSRYWYVILLVSLGRGQEALDQLALVVRDDPFAPRGVTVMERYAGWLVTGERAHLGVPVDKRPYPILAIEPGEAFALADQAMDRAHQRDCPRARLDVERAAGLVPAGNIRILAFVSEVYWLCGDRQASREVLESMKRSPRAHEHGHWIAMRHSTMGEPDSAFAWLDRTEWSLGQMSGLSADRRYDPIRPDPRFAAHLRRMGLRQR